MYYTTKVNYNKQQYQKATHKMPVYIIFFASIIIACLTTSTILLFAFYCLIDVALKGKRNRLRSTTKIDLPKYMLTQQNNLDGVDTGSFIDPGSDVGVLV